MAVRIVTDSACDLPEAACAELGIEVVPLTIRFGEREYVDRVELNAEAFWRELLASPVLPETAAPSVGAFEETFRRVAAEGADGIVCVNLSSRLSATMQSAQLAARALEGEIEIAVVDSLSASMGEGNLALVGARAAAAGATGVAALRTGSFTPFLRSSATISGAFRFLPHWMQTNSTAPPRCRSGYTVPLHFGQPLKHFIARTSPAHSSECPLHSLPKV